MTIVIKRQILNGGYMMYNYYPLHWEVDVEEKLYDDGKPMLINTYRFESEDMAIKYAKERHKEGRPVYVRIVQLVEDWA